MAAGIRWALASTIGVVLFVTMVNFSVAEEVLPILNQEMNTLHYDTFMDRCSTIKPGPSTNIPCTRLWDNFIRSFACENNQCEAVKDQTKYEIFIQGIPPTTSANQAMFYSGVSGDVAQKIASRCANKTTIHETFLGRLFDRLAWCCNRGIVVDHPCGRDKTCSNRTLEIFWEHAFRSFAANSGGDLAILLNGSSDGLLYDEDSFFSRTQLPYLTQNVKSMSIIVVYARADSEDTTPLEPKWTCESEGSGVLALQVEMLRRQIGVSCTQDPMWSSRECSGADLRSVCHWLISTLVLIHIIRLI